MIYSLYCIRVIMFSDKLPEGEMEDGGSRKLMSKLLYRQDERQIDLRVNTRIMKTAGVCDLCSFHNP